MRVTTNQQMEYMKYSLGIQAKNVDKSQQQVASGNKYEKYSDEPLLANQSLILNNSYSKVEQYEKNVKDANTYLSSTEAALGRAVQLFTEIKATVVEANNGTMNEQNLKTYAAVIKENINQLENIANTNFLGKYLFAGEKTLTKPYQIENGNMTYKGDDQAVKIRVSVTKDIEISMPGDKIFGESFAVLNDLYEALENGDKTTISNMIDGIEGLMNKVVDARSEIGVRMESMDMYQDLYSKEKLNLKTQISAVEDADLAAAMIDLTQNKLIQNSILAITSEMNKNSLLNYM